MKKNIKLVAVDIDRTFVRSDYTYDAARFQRILSIMKDAGCGFVAASAYCEQGAQSAVQPISIRRSKRLSEASIL